MGKKTAIAEVKKLPAVRLIVQELGVDASVADIRRMVKERYNHDLTDAVAQNYASIAKREVRGGSVKSRRAKRSKPIESSSSAATTPQAPSNGAAVGQVVDAVKTLKDLAGTLGRNNLSKLVEAM